ncbi:Hypothetical predicted protein [Octopus vulgaris]|uniref:Uncharacterized protein n=1 Tax=Octopus vulgaris TaxID=6645 RepID=A0AA36FC95_OCTVU|nr:Hypothetical predicted protein [Octopus vulgaris]
MVVVVVYDRRRRRAGAAGESGGGGGGCGGGGEGRVAAEKDKVKQLTHTKQKRKGNYVVCTEENLHVSVAKTKTKKKRKSNHTAAITQDCELVYRYFPYFDDIIKGQFLPEDVVEACINGKNYRG